MRWAAADSALCAQLRLTRDQEDEKQAFESSIEEAQFEADQEEDPALKAEKAAEVDSRKAKLDDLLAGFEARGPSDQGRLAWPPCSPSINLRHRLPLTHQLFPNLGVALQAGAVCALAGCTYSVHVPFHRMRGTRDRHDAAARARRSSPWTARGAARSACGRPSGDAAPRRRPQRLAWRPAGAAKGAATVTALAGAGAGAAAATTTAAAAGAAAAAASGALALDLPCTSLCLPRRQLLSLSAGLRTVCVRLVAESARQAARAGVCILDLGNKPQRHPCRGGYNNGAGEYGGGASGGGSFGSPTGGGFGGGRGGGAPRNSERGFYDVRPRAEPGRPCRLWRVQRRCAV